MINNGLISPSFWLSLQWLWLWLMLTTIILTKTWLSAQLMHIYISHTNLHAVFCSFEMFTLSRYKYFRCNQHLSGYSSRWINTMLTGLLWKNFPKIGINTDLLRMKYSIKVNLTRAFQLPVTIVNYSLILRSTGCPKNHPTLVPVIFLSLKNTFSKIKNNYAYGLDS